MSFKGTNVTEKLEDLNLGSDDDADIIMIAASSKNPVILDQEAKLIQKANPNIVRLSAVVDTTNPPRKESKAKKGAKYVLNYLHKMAERQSEIFSLKEMY